MIKVLRMVMAVIVPTLRKKVPVNSTATCRRKCWAQAKMAQPTMAQRKGKMRLGSWYSGSRCEEPRRREMRSVSLSASGPPATYTTTEERTLVMT